MKRMTICTIIVLLGLSIFTQNVVALSQCTCTPNTAAFPGATQAPSETIQISPDDELVGTTNVGKIISFGTTSILQNLYIVNKQSTSSLSHTCPSGYVPFTKDELTALTQRADFSSLIGSTYLNLDTSLVYYSSTKTYPAVTNGSDNNAYVYTVLKFDAQKKPQITTDSTYWVADAKRKTLCKRVLTNFAIGLKGYEGYDLEEGQTYEFQVTNSNVLQYYIEDSNGKLYTTQTFKYTHKGNTQWGCATINFRLQLFGGIIASDCLGIWTLPRFAYNADSNISIDQIQTVTIDGVKANVNNGMFFSPGSVPLAPIVNDSSSVYIYYSEQKTNALKVLKLSKEGKPVGSAIDTKEAGQPFDIVSTHYGFVVMARDSTQKAWITAFNKDGTQRWKRVLINNGDGPLTPVEQISFYTNDKCELPFGMGVMYNPHNGRLNYARGRIQAIWAHYNHFGMKSDGSKNDHTGDTMITLDADTGYNQKIYSSWGASHSLYQNFHYDGKYLFVSSLGDAYPMNIMFRACEVDGNLSCKSSSAVIPGDIPGNGGGSSSGRTGGFIDIIGNRSQKYYVYQRKACNGGYAGTTSTNDKNEFALITLDKTMTLISTKIIFDADLASRVNAIKAVPYGKNILIAYSLIPAAKVANFNPQSITQASDESYLMLLSGADGSTLYGPTKFANYQVNSSDDWRVLEDGRIAYTIVDKNNVINFYYTPALTTPNYPNPIKSADITYGYNSFLNSKITPGKNNYNDVCVKKGDSNYSVIDFPTSSDDQGSNNNNTNGNNTNNTNNNSGNSSGSNNGSSSSSSEAATTSNKLVFIYLGLIISLLI